ncbi:hypothetical protein HQ584_01720 [Patescibacteria group bacterium]|nr:hypothetical protein [Patescibacteria group bacterium]
MLKTMVLIAGIYYIAQVATLPDAQMWQGILGGSCIGIYRYLGLIE